MKAERAIFEKFDPDAEAAAGARAEVDIEVGRVIYHDKVAPWLAKWGEPDEVPAPPKQLA